MSAPPTQIVATYEYPAGQDPDPVQWTGLASLSDAGDERGASAPNRESSENPVVSNQRSVEQEIRQSFEEGRRTERDAHAGQHRAEKERFEAQYGALMVKFEAARDRYLQDVEREVVELALAVAARILRRETQMDPLLLTGAVRVALGQLSNTTRVRLLVPQQDRDLWSEAIRLLPHLTLRPEVIAGDNLARGDCRIETEIGSVDLGLRTQLSEIERGFFGRTADEKSVSPETALIAPSGTDKEHA